MNLTIEAIGAWDEQDCDATSGNTLPLGAHLVTERKGYEHPASMSAMVR